MFDTLSIIGLCFILKYGTILDFIRNPLKEIPFFRDLFSCSLCLGFWCGLIHGLFLGNILQFALFGAAVCWIADHLIDVMQTYIYGRE